MALWFPVRKIISYPHLVCNVFFYRLHHCSQIKNLRIPKNSGDSRESNQVKINQVLCCILTISRFYIGQADVTVNLGGSQISMPKNRCRILYVHPSDQQVCGLHLHNQHILYQIFRLFIYRPCMASITCCIMPVLISIPSTSKIFLANPVMICYHKKGESHRSGSTL